MYYVTLIPKVVHRMSIRVYCTKSDKLHKLTSARVYEKEEKSEEKLKKKKNALQELPR